MTIFGPPSCGSMAELTARRVRLLAMVLLLFAAGCQSVQRGKVYRYQQADTREAQVASAKRSYRLALGQIRLQDYASARQNLEAATRYDPRFGKAFNNLGWVYFHEDNLYQAEWAFRRAAALMSRDPRPLSNLGLVMERESRWDEAVELHRRTRTLEPSNVHFAARLARARVKRGDDDPQLRALLEEVERGSPGGSWPAWARREIDRRDAAPPL